MADNEKPGGSDRMRAWVAANRDHYNALQRAYRARRRERDPSFRESEITRLREWSKVWADENPEKAREAKRASQKRVRARRSVIAAHPVEQTQERERK